MKNKINISIIIIVLLYILIPITVINMSNLSSKERAKKREREDNIIGLEPSSIDIYSYNNVDYLKIDWHDRYLNEKYSFDSLFSQKFEKTDRGFFIILNNRINLRDLKTLFEVMDFCWKSHYDIWYDDKDLSQLEMIDVNFSVETPNVKINKSYTPVDALQRIIEDLAEYEDKLQNEDLYLSFNYMGVEKDTQSHSFPISRNKDGKYEYIDIKGRRLITAIKISDHPQTLIEEELKY